MCWLSRKQCTVLFVKCLLPLSPCFIPLITETDSKHLALNNHRAKNNIDKTMKHGGSIKYHRIPRHGSDAQNEMVECNSS